MAGTPEIRCRNHPTRNWLERRESKALWRLAGRTEQPVPRRRPLAETLEDEPLAPQRFGLGRDTQAALDRSVGRLERARIIDDGVERVIESGKIDITTSGAKGRLAVIELKGGFATARAVAQLLGNMGDLEVFAT